MFDLDQEEQALLDALREVAAAREAPRERRDAAREVLGVANHQLVEVARSWHREHADAADDAVWALASALWRRPVEEAQLLASRLLAPRISAVEPLTWDEVASWRAEVDSVETGDAFAFRVLGPWVIADVEQRIVPVRTMLDHGDLLDRRLAILVTVWLNRGRPGVTHPELTVEFLDAALEEREPLVLHAVSWALRALARAHAPRVREYLASRPMLDDVVRGEVLNWLATGSLRGDSVHAWRIPAALDDPSAVDER